MKFSIIIPVYNSAPYLNKCIDSIFNQSYSDFELILIDDGSTDNSYDICKEYAKHHENIIVVHQENSGPSIARNHGIQISKGDYILFVDSDDWVSKDYFSVLDKAIKTNPDMVFFGGIHLSDNKRIKKLYPERNLAGKSNITKFFTDNYYEADSHSCANKVFSSSLIKENNISFPLNTVVEEDLIFILKAIEYSTKAISISEAIYFYNRRSSGSVTTKYNPKKFECKVSAYVIEESFAKSWNEIRLLHYFQDNYLSYISSSINNLMYKECELTVKQKVDEIRKYYQNDVTLSCIKCGKPLSIRSKVMWILISLRLYKISYLLHYIIFNCKGR